MLTRATSRRRFLGLLAGALPAGSVSSKTAAQTRRGRAASDSNGADRGSPTVGIALGAGGASGLAHILMLEALDEMAIRPHRIAGSSIGAVIGALYASGMTGKELRELVEGFIIEPGERLVEELIHRDALRWVEFLEIDLGNGGLLSSEGFVSFLYETLEHDRFEALDIPLKIAAADLWERCQVVLESGPLLPAIKASMALPGVFCAVVQDDRVLVDGGTVNPVPYDLLLAECEIVIGIDVIGQSPTPDDLEPGYFETIFNSVKVMQQAIMDEKLHRVEPAIYLAPSIVGIRALEFHRAEEVFAQARPAKAELKRRLAGILESW
jgi:NTE family protein